MPAKIVGHFDMLPAPRFSPEEGTEGLPPDQAIEAINEGVLRGQRQLAQKMWDLSAFLEEYVANLIDAGNQFPNLTQNGNFAQGAPESPNSLPNFWIPVPGTTAPTTISYVAPPTAAGAGNAVQIGVGGGGGGDLRRIQQKICIQPGRGYHALLWYKTDSLTEGAVARLVPTSGTTVEVSLPATGGAWRAYPAAGDIPLSITGAQPLSGLQYVNLQIGSVAAPAVAQNLSFAGISFVDGPQTAPYKPSPLDMAMLCRGFVPHTYQTTNGDLTANLAAGQVVTPGLTSGVRPANSSVLGKDAASGIALESAQPGDYLRVQTSGLVELADWTAATGGASLTPGAIYYLDASDGMMTTTAPANPQVVGQAMGTQRLLMQAPPASTGALTHAQIEGMIALRLY